MHSGTGPLLVAALLFIGAHVGISSTPLRPRLVQALGERAYLAMYSVLQIALLVWLIAAFRAAEAPPLWVPAPWLRQVPVLAMPLALVFLIAGVATPNPTAVMAGAPAASRPADTGIFRVTRHPVMWAIALWSGAHLAVSGDARRLIFFGTFLVLALAGTLLIERRKKVEWGTAWAPFAAHTSNIPFVALLTGRTRVGFGEIGWRWIVAGFAAALLISWFHGALFGVAVRP